MSLYQLPDGLCDELHKNMNGYWWNGGRNSSIRWMKWQRLCIPKDHGGIGFKDLKQFNKAMLAKQAWRILDKPHSLVARLLQARYFKNQSFLDAQIGHSPSAIWRSICSAREVMRIGARKRIGNGHRTAVWGDPWLPSTEHGYITTHPSADLQSIKVADLFHPHYQAWDEQKIRHLFNQRDQNLILSLPLSLQNLHDGWTWLLERDGNYSVRSGYKTIVDVESSLPAQPQSCLWKQIWKIKALPKMINLLWRAAFDCLPTRYKLLQKRITASAVCPICGDAAKTAHHILVACPFAKEVWLRSGVGWFVGNSITIPDWLSLILSKVPINRHGDIAAICWALWKNRNSVIWTHRRSSHSQVLWEGLNTLSYWRKANVGNAKRQNELVVDKWVKPPPLWTKVNVDAAVLQSGGSISSVHINAEGLFCRAWVQSFRHIRDPLVLEVMVIREALSWIKIRQLSCAIIESDCQEAVNAILLRQIGSSSLSSLISDCVLLLSSLINVRVEFTRRSANQAAHCLARAADSYSDHHVWVTIPPHCISAALAEDSIQ